MRTVTLSLHLGIHLRAPGRAPQSRRCSPAVGYQLVLQSCFYRDIYVIKSSSRWATATTDSPVSREACDSMASSRLVVDVCNVSSLLEASFDLLDRLCRCVTMSHLV